MKGERNKAKLRGDKYYNSGKPCVHGHVSLKRVDNGRCLECLDILRNSSKMVEYQKQYQKDNREHINLVSKEYNENNKDHLNEWRRQYRIDNWKKVREKEIRYSLTEKGKATKKLDSSKRRVLIKKSTVENITHIDLQNILEYYNYQCVYCGEPYQEIDHVNPIAKGGTHTIDNLVPACSSCNVRKHAKILFEEWFPKNYVSIVELASAKNIC